MNRIEKAYTFMELANVLTSTPVIKLDTTPIFTQMYFFLFDSITPALETYWTTGIGATLFKSLFLKNYDNVVVITEKTPDNILEFEEASSTFGRKFYAIWDKTHDYYEKLLSFYDSQKNKLLDGLTTHNKFTNKFNDTPDNSGNFGNDDHTTNITYGESTNTADNLTPMQKLDEIKRLYDDVYTRWVNEFDSLFISKLNFYEDCDL